MLSGRDFLQRLNDLELLVFQAADDAAELGVHVHQHPAQFLDLHHLRLDGPHRWLDCLLVLWGDLQNSCEALHDAEHGAITGEG